GRGGAVGSAGDERAAAARPVDDENLSGPAGVGAGAAGAERSAAAARSTRATGPARPAGAGTGPAEGGGSGAGAVGVPAERPMPLLREVVRTERARTDLNSVAAGRLDVDAVDGARHVA